jgi:hypothetical protein
MVFSNHIYFQIQSEKDLEKSKKKRGGVCTEKGFHFCSKWRINTQK